MPNYFNAHERMLDFNKRHKPHGVQDTYKLMQKRYLALQKLGVPPQVFYPSTDLIEVSPYIQLQHIKGVLNNHTMFSNASEETLFTLEHFWGLQLFGSWRYTLGMYRIDEDIFEDVISSKIPDDTPTEIFKNLPEWSVFVQFPNPIKMQSSNVEYTADGFWATFDCKLNKYNQPKLLLNIVPNLTYFSDDDFISLSYKQLQPIVFYIEDGLSIKQSVQMFLEQQESIMKDNIFHINKLMKNDYTMLTHFLSCLLLLCVEKPDVSKITGEPISRSELHAPKHKINKKTGVFIPPEKPLMYDVGARLGGEIRKKRAEIEQGLSDGTRTMRPHIRRGHWHGFWKGTGQNKHFEVKWLSAIFVGA